jgi:hypothetical protein
MDFTPPPPMGEILLKLGSNSSMPLYSMYECLHDAGLDDHFEILLVGLRCWRIRGRYVLITADSTLPGFCQFSLNLLHSIHEAINFHINRIL